jgi:hypothetical protein
MTPDTAFRPSWWAYPVVGLASFAAVPVALAAAFLALIEGSGCFIECAQAEPNPLAAMGLVVLALLAVVLGPGLAKLLMRTWSAVGIAVGVQAVGGLFFLVSFV